MQLKSFLEKVDELTKCATQNAEKNSVLKTKIRELDNSIEEFGVKIGLTPKETVDVNINTQYMTNSTLVSLVKIEYG